MLKSFPGEAPELDSLTAHSGRSHTKTAPGCRVFLLLDGQAKDIRTLTGKQIQAGATAHQYTPEIVRKENRNAGYRCLKVFPGKPRSLIH